MPHPIQRQAKRAYERFEQNPYHASLQFRQVKVPHNQPDAPIDLDGLDDSWYNKLGGIC